MINAWYKGYFILARRDGCSFRWQKSWRTYLKIDVAVEKLDNTGGRATYAEIKDYIKEKYGYSISSLYIAQMKDKVGLEKRDNYNHGTGKTARVPQCTPEKEEAIMDAFRHFKMI